LKISPIFEGARQAILKGTLNSSYAAILLFTALVIFGLAVYIFNRKIEE